MLKFVALVALGSALACGTAAAASPGMLTPPGSPGTIYVLPGAADGYPANGLVEGRSMYRMEDPATFFDGSDERGYRSGDPQNPRSGD